MFAPIQTVTHHSIATPQSLAGLNPLDWFLLLTLTISAFFAFLRGLIRSLVSLAGVVAGVLLAAWYGERVAVWLSRWVHSQTVAEGIGFLGVFVLCYLLAALLGRLLRSACQAVGLGIFDRLGGAVFGFLRAVLVIAAVMIPAAPFLPLIPFARDSVLLPYLRTAAHGISFVMPRDFENRLSAGARSIHTLAPAREPRSLAYSSSSTGPKRTAEGEAQ